MSLAVLADLTQVGGMTEEEESSINVSFVTRAERAVLQARKASPRLHQESVSHTVSIRAHWNHQEVPQVKLGGEGQGSRPHLLHRLCSSDEWRWIGIIPGQP